MFTPKGSKYPQGRPRPGSRSGTPLSGSRRTVGTPLLSGRLKHAGAAGGNTPVSSRCGDLETFLVLLCNGLMDENHQVPSN